jgi:hypothetical protein
MNDDDDGALPLHGCGVEGEARGGEHDNVGGGDDGGGVGR